MLSSGERIVLSTRYSVLRIRFSVISHVEVKREVTEYRVLGTEYCLSNVAM